MLIAIYLSRISYIGHTSGPIYGYRYQKGIAYMKDLIVGSYKWYVERSIGAYNHIIGSVLVQERIAAMLLEPPAPCPVTQRKRSNLQTW